MSMYEQKSEYIRCVREKLNVFYNFGDVDSEAKKTSKEQIKGFIEAGIVTEIITYDEFGEIADEIHFEIFGKTIEERNIEARLGHQDDTLKWSRFEEPTYVRNKKLGVKPDK